MQPCEKHGAACGCCEGIEKVTPEPTANRPGLDELAYRVGTHASFLETMQAGLTGLSLEALGDGDDGDKEKVYPLRSLTTREDGDPAIALLDAWATVADVLTFYQERIANEGYLRTANERRSILELARLIGYELRPGVAASVYLAFTLEDGERVEIPAGTQARSKPGPGESPQTFETSEPLEARAAWNALKPRMSRPWWVSTDANVLYLQGTETGLQPNDPMLIESRGTPTFRQVRKVEPDQAADRTKVTLQPKTRAQVTPEMSSAETRLLPQSLHAQNLRAVVGGLRNVSNLSTEELEQLVQQFATALLTTFAALAEMSPSDTRDEAMEQVGAVLKSVEESVSRAMNVSDSIFKRRLERLQSWTKSARAILGEQAIPPEEGKEARDLGGVIRELLKPVPANSIPPMNSARLRRDPRSIFGKPEVGQSDAGLQLLSNLQPALQSKLYPAWRSVVTIQPDGGDAKVYALRVKASLFGHNAPILPQYKPNGDLRPRKEWVIPSPAEEDNVLFLDGEYDEILPDSESYIAIQKPGKSEEVFDIRDVNIQSRSEYGISAKTTRITLPEGESWKPPDPEDDFHVIRETRAYAQSEELELAESPLDPTTDPINGNGITLDGVYEELQSGQWVIVSGERLLGQDADGKLASGKRETELVMLAGADQITQYGQPENRVYTELNLANELAYAYKRDTVTIWGNVVKGTHGETQEEVEGSGDGSQARQTFTLKKSPLTYLPAPTPAGAESTLELRVNEVEWHEADNLFELGPTDRGFITRIDDNQETTISTGDGEHGARLPTGVENVKAVYRTGIGKAGNVEAEQISMLASRPLGVKGVVNPLPASGGADRESRDQARRNAPLAVMALDRLVSVQDYADFARTFAGIGKASARELSDGRRELVHLTIAGADDIPIAKTSDLYRNLRRALHEAGDPHQPLQIDVRELKLLFIEAGIRVLPDYQWESVAPDIRAALLDTFSFRRRRLGQDVVRSEVISIIERVPGVAYVDVDTFNAVDEKITVPELEKLGSDLKRKQRIVARMDRVQRYHLVEREGQTWESIAQRYDVDERKLRELNPGEAIEIGVRLRIPPTIQPAQLVYLSPEVPDTLILTVIE